MKTLRFRITSYGNSVSFEALSANCNKRKTSGHHDCEVGDRLKNNMFCDFLSWRIMENSLHENENKTKFSVSICFFNMLNLKRHGAAQKDALC